MKTVVVIVLHSIFQFIYTDTNPCTMSERTFIPDNQLSEYLSTSELVFSQSDATLYNELLLNECAFVTNDSIIAFAECTKQCTQDGYCIAFAYARDDGCKTCVLTLTEDQEIVPQSIFIDATMIGSILHGNCV